VTSHIDLWHGLVRCRLAFFNIQEIQQGRISQEFQNALNAGILTEQDLCTRRVVFDSLFEGQGPEEFQAVIDSLRDHPWFDLDRVIFLNNVFDDCSSEIKSVRWPWQMVNHCGWFDHVRGLGIDWSTITRDRDFVCLMRRRSTQRGHLFRSLRQRYAPSTYTISYASMIDYRGYDAIAETEIPVLLDGPTPGEQQHRAQDLSIFRCMINLVVETSNQEPSSEISWKSRFVTEKTFKCFAWHQVPIWWTVPGLVADVRSLGFDVFDDIMQDHCYDEIQNADHRIAAMLDTLDQAISKIHKVGIMQFHEQVFSRLQKNHDRLVELTNLRMPYWPEILQRVKTI